MVLGCTPGGHTLERGISAFGVPSGNPPFLEPDPENPFSLLNLLQDQRRKNVHYHHPERKYFWDHFWPQRRTFQAGGRYKYHWHRNQSEAKQNDFRINYLQNYESESESEIWGEVSMWTWMRKIICPININTKAKAKDYFRGINFTLISVSTVSYKKKKTQEIHIHHRNLSSVAPMFFG